MNIQDSAFESISVSHLELVTGGQQGAQQPANPPKPAINQENYSYWGGEAGRVPGEILNSPTLARHGESLGRAIGNGLYNAGSWLGEQAGRMIYGN